MAKQKAKDLLMIAGANGNLSNKEANKIAKKSGKTLDQVIGKAVKGGTSLGSNLVNKYNAGPDSLDPVQSNSRGGFAGLARRRTSPTIFSQIRNAGTLDKGSSLFIGSKGSTSTVLPKSMLSGAGTKSAPQTTDPVPTTAPPNTDTITPGGNTTGSGGLAAASASPVADPFMMGPGGMSSDLDGSAKGFRKNRSSARKAGLTTKGTSQFKISMAQGAKSGLNTGY